MSEFFLICASHLCILCVCVCVLTNVLKDLNCFVEQNLLKPMTCEKVNKPPSGTSVQILNERKGTHQTTGFSWAHLLCEGSV